jgi:hypothetical protein
MTEHKAVTRLPRRTVLRGAIAAGAVSTGLVGFSGSVLASACPRTPGFWANHNWCEVPIDPNEPEGTSVAESIDLDCNDIENDEYCLGGTDSDVCKTMEDWQDFLVMSTKGDKGVKMAQTLLATILNFQRATDDSDNLGTIDATCEAKEVDFSAYDFGLDETTTVIEVKRRAEDWLEDSNFDDSQTQWTVDGVDGEPLKSVLDAYNNGEIEELDCNCPAEDD